MIAPPWQSGPAAYPGPEPRARTLCPYCLNHIDWSDYGEVPLVKNTPDGPEVLTRAPDEPEVRWRHRTLGAMRQCHGDGDPHSLPADYGDLDPLIIGLVGASAAGKTHLLTAMIAQLERRKAMLAPELRIEPLDGHLRQRFYEERIRPFLEQRRVLPATRRSARAEFVYALRVSSEYTGRTHAVGFFDVPGEHYHRYEYEDTPFLSLADAILYVADGQQLRTGDDWNPWVPDPGFTHAITQLLHTRQTRDGLLPPGALVVAKSDMLAGLDGTVAHWLGRDDETVLGDLRTVEDENEAAYAFLARHGAELWLAPFHSGSPTTLHFASASGVPPIPEEGVFPHRDFRPTRVLRPLLSLFSATGLVPRIDTEEPGQYL
ncbi:hypothetical protein BKA00_002413 [Actinomadura coerulea]|uniref:Double-GTPase 2 domain-containing protein n=1 Tax=Actinomadura coerulea TaxID=46159 RepID=A0A7X0FXD6_9ACTN|nr:hypothetical protein [Actinomadura coerulea]MBB6395499.1 hypothetical protein [Actinomadura coerulea]GGQ25838.1 hypothetical protein GCM10010187_48070 [Actinomadura coerulea]